MKVTIVTITHNNARGLSRTIASISRQTHDDIEHIIVDGLSEDDTADIIRHEAPNAVVISAEPRGVYDAINQGIKVATGDIIGLLHAGDTFTASATLEGIVNRFENDDELDYLYGDIHFVKPETDRVTRYYSADNFTKKRFREGYAPPHPSLYMRRSAQARVGEYDNTYKIAGDFEMFLRLFYDATLKGCYIGEDVVAMDTGGISTKLYNKLFVNNQEKIKALRSHNINASYFSVLKHYFYIAKHKKWTK